ncbi:unnamed protein product [Mytilus edulis]|uniref:Uncharacterized protein n=1 Tax=Mytilus edulis TaxID=6550 RepID=A0A8S3UGV8_MYTED|nr:unnamed protein product [Mytilus edulis]
MFYVSANDTTTVYSVINSREGDSPVYAVIALYTLVFAIVAGIVIIIKRCRKYIAFTSKSSGISQNIIVTETIESSDCSNINNDKIAGVNIPKIKNTQDIKTSIEQEDRICNKYESLSTNRNSVEHIYESDSIHTNQYESLSKQRESDKHTYESTEHALPVSMEQELSPYQSLTNPPESDKHVYASTHTNQYESLSKQRESDKHTYESTEHALPVSMEQYQYQYQSFTNPRIRIRLNPYPSI